MSNSIPLSLSITGLVSVDGMNIVRSYFEHYQIADIATMNFQNNILYITVNYWFNNNNSKTIIDSISINGYTKVYYDIDNYFTVSVCVEPNVYRYLNMYSNKVYNNDEEFREDAVAHDNIVEETFTDSEGSIEERNNCATIQTMLKIMDNHTLEMEKIKNYINESHRCVIRLNKTVAHLKKTIESTSVHKTIIKSYWNGRLRSRK